jgi:hypothetical protein
MNVAMKVVSIKGAKFLDQLKALSLYPVKMERLLSHK